MVPSTNSERGYNKFEDKDPDENPRDYLNIPLSNQPGVGKPKDNIKQTKLKQKMLEHKRKT